VALLRRAQETFPGDFWINHNLGQALHNGRPPRREEAIRFLTAAVALRPQSAGARFNLGLALLHHDRPDEAAASFREAVAVKPDYPMAHFELGNALWKAGRLDEAAAAFRRATGLKPDFAEPHCNLGLVLRQQGQFVASLAALRRGHELGSPNPFWRNPSARWVEEGQRLVELDRRLPAVLRGEEQPADAAEGHALAEVCYYKKLFVAAGRLRSRAFSADPNCADDLEAGYRYDAACAAALAGCGRGEDVGQLDDKGLARWRKQAVEWLRADLTAYGNLLEGGSPDGLRLVRQRLRHWQRDPDLAGLRDPAALARLPAEERQACERLWAGVRLLLARVDAGG
jgi:serine/threonine-protein kinase